ncbi:hypothetical protein FFONT_0696 [Fervidicoccus fontis Kam940]|uniref:Uncharacterized protein n=1 Tax=Fervidicoccus fontis (strain DSM 19380 / JCM 18336 / VKM B-2539 / Kam940) TaxID=1163730 RepID=I0A127_FERFK|nr:hypothetical protein FFONT_0696 [Fervidicoccus fontis Kam940]
MILFYKRLRKIWRYVYILVYINFLLYKNQYVYVLKREGFLSFISIAHI